MKVTIIQPYYSFDKNDTQMCFDEMVKLLDQCDESHDLIVLPEYSDIPAVQGSKRAFHESIEKYNRVIMDKAKAAAVRCNAIVFVNAAETVVFIAEFAPDIMLCKKLFKIEKMIK